MNINNFGIVQGRLTRDPKFFDNKDGSRTVLLTVAVDNNFKNKDGSYGTQFVNLEAFERADYDKTKSVYNHVGQGAPIGLQYTAKSGQFEDENGKTVYTQTLQIESVQLLETKEEKAARLAKKAEA